MHERKGKMNGIKRIAALMLAAVLAAAPLPVTAGASEITADPAPNAELDPALGTELNSTLGTELDPAPGTELDPAPDAERDPDTPAAQFGATADGRAVIGARLVDNVTCLPLRSVCEDAGYSVSWNAAANTASVSGEDLQMTVTPGAAYLISNDRYIYLDKTAQVFDGTLYVPARPLAKALGWNVEWDGSTKTAVFTSTGGTITSGEEFYNGDEVLWLARIITAEAGGEPFLGQIAVGAVVLNRVRSPRYPNTIYGVIFDRVGGVQFEPTLNGRIWCTPGANAVIAAKLALEGTNPVGGSLFFLNPSIAKSSWIQRNRTFFVRIGRHEFYL